MVVIRTASGKQLSCTPNHPVLTPSGWVKAHALNVGSYVVSQSLTQRESLGVVVNHQNMPTPIEQIANAHRVIDGMLSVPVPLASQDFHGDGMDGDVAVIAANRLLLDDVEPARNEHFRQDILGRRFMSLPCLPRNGLGFQGRFGASAPPDSLVSRSSLAPAGVRPHTSPFRGLGFGSAANRYASTLERPSDSITAYAMPLREDVDRIAGLVGADKVVEVARYPFSGHVYNLETESGMYVADGIVTHNCRCTVIYRTSEAHQQNALAAPAVNGKLLSEARCPNCSKLLGRGVTAGIHYCRGCKATVHAIEAAEPKQPVGVAETRRTLAPDLVVEVDASGAPVRIVRL